MAISFFGGYAIARSHWDTYAAGAASRNLPADRARFRICRDVCVAYIDMDFIAEHVWLCGSPETVTRKIEESHERTGGYGEIVAAEVVPNVRTPETAVTS